MADMVALCFVNTLCSMKKCPIFLVAHRRSRALIYSPTRSSERSPREGQAVADLVGGSQNAADGQATLKSPMPPASRLQKVLGALEGCKEDAQADDSVPPTGHGEACVDADGAAAKGLPVHL